MENQHARKPSIAKFGEITRRPIALKTEGATRRYYMDAERKLPLVIHANASGTDVVSWARENRGTIETDLLEHGAVLFRNFSVDSVNDFERFIHTVSGSLLEYQERSSPRHPVNGRIYSSTDYPAHQPIFLHNENSYAHSWPRKIFFHCVTPARDGGETPIADVRRVFDRIRPEVREKFARLNVLYVRNFGEGLGLAWQDVYQTDSKSAVEEYCRKTGYEVEWFEGNRLRTRRVAQAVAAHPVNGRMSWFNHATFFHITTLDSRIQKALLEECGEQGLPNNTYYGDGSRIESDVLDELRDAYKQETAVFSWEKGDILMIDNMSVAHGRTPYSGPRKIVVGMSEPSSYDQLSPRV